MRFPRCLAAGLSALVCLAPFSGAARADSFRCGTRTIQEGMSSQEVRMNCGEPDLVRVREEPVYTRLQNGATIQTGVARTDDWYYDRGPTQFVVLVAVRDSVAAEIEILSVRNIRDLPDE